MTRIEALARGLRRAVAAEQFAEVRQVAEEYARAVEDQWNALPSGDPGREQLWREARFTLDWARQTVMAQRALIGDQLSAVDSLAAYLRTQVSEQSTWQLQG